MHQKRGLQVVAQGYIEGYLVEVVAMYGSGGVAKFSFRLKKDDLLVLQDLAMYDSIPECIQAAIVHLLPDAMKVELSAEPEEADYIALNESLFTSDPEKQISSIAEAILTHSAYVDSYELLIHGRNEAMPRFDAIIANLIDNNGQFSEIVSDAMKLKGLMNSHIEVSLSVVDKDINTLAEFIERFLKQ